MKHGAHEANTVHRNGGRRGSLCRGVYPLELDKGLRKILQESKTLMQNIVSRLDIGKLYESPCATRVLPWVRQNDLSVMRCRSNEKVEFCGFFVGR